MIEFERKFKFEHTNLREKLISIGAKEIRKEVNDDIYFNHPERNFKETDEVLRVRSVNQEIELTYKGKRLGNNSKSRKEVNVKIINGSIELLLECLGFEKLGNVKKTREVWEYKHITICLDKIADLGEFVEIEILKNDKGELKHIENEFDNLEEELGINTEQIRDSYFELLNRRK